MSKIGRLRIALKTGQFWAMFKSKPIEDDFTPVRSDIQAKSLEIWTKYTELKRRYLNGEVWIESDSPLFRRYEALYEAQQRDMARFLRNRETT